MLLTWLYRPCIRGYVWIACGIVYNVLPQSLHIACTHGDKRMHTAIVAWRDREKGVVTNILVWFHLCREDMYIYVSISFGRCVYVCVYVCRVRVCVYRVRTCVLECGGGGYHHVSILDTGVCYTST